MNTEEKILRLSLNPKIIGKPGKKNRLHFATCWLEVEITPDDFVAAVTVEGWAYSTQFKDRYRKAANFLCCDFIAADIDHGWTIDEMLGQPFVREHAAFLYTTPSHHADAHRFRVVFLLDLTITDPTRWKLALAGLARKFNGDSAIADGARMFYGNSGSEVHLIQKVLSAEALEELVELGRFQKQTFFTDTQGKVVSSRSKIKLKSEQMLTLESGETLELSAIPAGASVLCPVHLDHRPSAFVVESQHGTRGVHCRTCQSTFWRADPGDYDFDAFDRLFVEKQRQEVNAIEEQVENSDNYLLRLFPPAPEINLFQRRYLGRRCQAGWPNQAEPR